VDDVHLVDGTYELFRHHYAPSNDDPERGAVRGVLRSLIGMLAEGATHVGVATDHVIESWRNDVWPSYKSSAGMDPVLLGQFGLLEDGLRALGMTVWAMVDHEADDALAAAARALSAHADVGQVRICTPDKDLAQCVDGDRVVLVDRRRRMTYDAAGVEAKYGVAPASIPDWLALVGDSADGFPGVPGWGAKSAAAALRSYAHLESIPADPATWTPPIRGAARLAEALLGHREEALLFRRLATLADGLDLPVTPAELAWAGPTDDLPDIAARLDAPDLPRRAAALRDRPAAR